MTVDLTPWRKLYASVNAAFFGGALPEVTIADAALPINVLGRYTPKKQLLEIDFERHQRRGLDPLTTFLHETSHASAPEAEHGAEFVREHARLAAEIWDVQLQARHRAGLELNPPKKEKTMTPAERHEDWKAGMKSLILETFAPRPSRPAGPRGPLRVLGPAPAVELQADDGMTGRDYVRAVQAFRRKYPFTAKAASRYRIVAGRVVPVFDEPGALTVNEAERRGRQSMKGVIQ
jgi:hypothetical protein